MRRNVLVFLMIFACTPGLSTDCDSASAEALPVYEAAAECLREARPFDAVHVDPCLVKARHALELIERAEEVCSGEILPEIRIAKAQLNEQIPMMEKLLSGVSLTRDEKVELIQRLLGLYEED